MRLLGVLLLWGCGGVRYDAGTSRGDTCVDFSVALCGRLIQCAAISQGERQSCLASIQAGCCGDRGLCAERAPLPYEAGECVNMLPGSDCDLYTGAVVALPSYCRGVF